MIVFLINMYEMHGRMSVLIKKKRGMGGKGMGVRRKDQ